MPWKRRTGSTKLAWILQVPIDQPAPIEGKLNVAPRTFSPKCLTSDAALERADLVLIADDLEHVRHCCREILNRNETLVRDTVTKALLDSASIRYRQCFGGGLRTRLKKDIVESLGARNVELHNIFRELADKHVAHAVNALELSATVIYIAIDESGNVTRGGLGYQGLSAVEISYKEINEIGEMVGRIIEKIKLRMQELDKIVKSEVDQMSDDEIRGLLSGFPPNLPKDGYWINRNWPPKSN